MTDTTTHIARRDMPRQDAPHCHDGEGTVDLTRVYDARRLAGPSTVRFIHDDVLPPGAGIGVHTHSDDEEYYLILSGTGRMTLDGREMSVSAGDLTLVRPGGSHGLMNDGAEPMRLLVIGAAQS